MWDHIINIRPSELLSTDDAKKLQPQTRPKGLS